MEPAGPERRLQALLHTAVRESVRIGGQHGAGHYRVDLADGRTVFAKVAGAGRELAGAGQELAAEASGLRWLGEAAAVPVPEVLGCDSSVLVIAWLPEGRADRQAAAGFGRDLAALHAAGSASFGSAWPGFIAGLPLGGAAAAAWPDWYASERLLPFARLAADSGALSTADVAAVEAVAGQIATLAGPAEPPSRIHGDCWSGNVLWSGGRGALIDPAAQGGHRETDLAMLALFGAPFLDRILGAYQEAAPLADGWRDRVPLHQLHPLLVHACLFGGGYAEPVRQAARAALRAGRPG